MKEQVQGIPQLVKALQELEKKLSNQILRTELRAAAKEVAADIKENAPVGETGDLRRAVKVRSAKRKKGRIGFSASFAKSKAADAWYGPFVDLGTAHQPAQNFIEKSFDSKAEQLKNELPQRIAKRIEQAAKEKK